MSTETTFASLNQMDNNLNLAKELVYDACGFSFTNVKQHLEGKEYAACSFELNGKLIQYRASKMTPTKIGQFVAIWKRNQAGITAPYDVSDDLDFMIITARSGDNFGQFIFPKSVLADKGIITCHGKEGKRGIRVYPPWDVATNKQAIKTQGWQLNYFFKIIPGNTIDFEFIKNLLKESY